MRTVEVAIVAVIVLIVVLEIYSRITGKSESGLL